MIYILAAIIAIVVLGICITRKPYAEDKPGVSGGAAHGADGMNDDDKDNEENLEG
jgi:hypothetical protein